MLHEPIKVTLPYSIIVDMKPERHRVFFESTNNKADSFVLKEDNNSSEQSNLCSRDPVDHTSMNFIISNNDRNAEVIDLESSQNTISDADTSQSEELIKENTSPDFITIDTDTISKNVDNNGKTSNLSVSNCRKDSMPVFKVMFRDESVSRQYRKQIKDFLYQLMSLENTDEQDDNSDLTLEIYDSDANSMVQNIDIATESDNSQDVICDTLFTVDKQPKLKDDLDVPTYGKKYKNMFEKRNIEPESEEKEDHAPKVTCFNCLDNHTLRDCPKPRIQANITKNRKIFNMKGGGKTVRYHLDDDQKFGHITPGQISSTLRKALGLKDNELPKHIYRMRTLGYPPGWLEEARLQHSGLELFNSDGLAEKDGTNEEGRFVDNRDKDQYDIRKIYDFPGFNVPPPPGIHDDYDRWAVHMQFAHTKHRMLLMLTDKKTIEGYKRKKLKISNTTSNDNPIIIPSEMEIEDLEEGVVECVPTNGLLIPPLPEEIPIKPPEPEQPPPPQETSSQPASENSHQKLQEIPLPKSPDNSTPSFRTSSPSLYELENIKKRLLIELQDSGSQQNPDSLKSDSPNSTLKLDMPPPSNEATPESKRLQDSLCSLNTSRGSVKSIDLGTPILQSTSPYSKLPSSEMFSKNICDVINFENLPDATGKYEHMTGVLQKVRNTLAKLNEE